VRARAAAQPGRLEVKEHERRPSRTAPGEKGRFVGRVVDPIGQLTDLVTAVTYRRLPKPVDDETAVAPLAAKGR